MRTYGRQPRAKAGTIALRTLSILASATGPTPAPGAGTIAIARSSTFTPLLKDWLKRICVTNLPRSVHVTPALPPRRADSQASSLFDHKIARIVPGVRTEPQHRLDRNAVQIAASAPVAHRAFADSAQSAYLRRSADSVERLFESPANLRRPSLSSLCHRHCFYQSIHRSTISSISRRVAQASA